MVGLRVGTIAAFCVTGLALAGVPSRAAAAAPQADSSVAGSAGTVSIQLDPLRTQVSFNAGTLHHVHGSFNLKGGLFALDSKTGVAQGEILVDAESEHSDDAKLDKKIQTQTLETAKYPGMFFHPEKVKGSLPAPGASGQLELEGSFNIHGKDHPLTVTVEATRMGQEVLLKTAFSVPYVKWGMKDASSFLMRDRTIRITVESHGTVRELAPHA